MESETEKALRVSIPGDLVFIDTTIFSSHHFLPVFGVMAFLSFHNLTEKNPKKLIGSKGII